MRTAINVLSSADGVKVYGGAPKTGIAWLEADYEEKGKNFLFAAGVFLLEGLRSIAEEYPGNCKLTIKKIVI